MTKRIHTLVLAFTLAVLAACELEESMGLPDSRERTYTTSTPVNPNDLNAIQDAIIRGAHGELPLVIPASAFIKSAGSTASILPSTAGDTWQFTTPPNDMITAPVLLPVGSRIVRISWRINKVSSGSGMVLQLAKRTADANAPIYSVTDASAGASWITVPSPDLYHTMAVDEPVWIVVQAGNVAHQFSYATIVYDRP
jgi:hypothetical protein